MKLFSTRHSHAELFVHVVWATKERVSVLDERLRTLVWKQSASTALAFGATLISFGGVPDHIHALLRYRPDLCVSKLVRALKASATRLIRRDVEGLSDFAWQAGYGAFSVSLSDAERVKSYIACQQQHHLSGDLWPDVEPEE
jgi:REP element-mobilizing transposase RayT